MTEIKKKSNLKRKKKKKKNNSHRLLEHYPQAELCGFFIRVVVAAALIFIPSVRQNPAN